MSIITKSRWWGYLDDQGLIHVKKYTTDRAIQNCEQMPFCKGIFDPFLAYDFNHAKMVIAKFVEEERSHYLKAKS